jgi:hypothetical protein
MTQLQKVLEQLDACAMAVHWVGERTLEEAWNQCERGDWMLWFAGKIEVDRKLLVLAACGCARKALKNVPEGEERPRIAIEAAEAWCRGEASIEDVRAAADAARAAAYAARAAADAADAAAYAARAAAYAAYAAADAADAAARAAAYAAYAAADAAAEAASLAQSANIVREVIPFAEIERACNEVGKKMEEK